MYLVLDIGGTHIRCALSKDGKTFDSAPTVLDTPKKWPDADKELRELLSKYKSVKAACVGLAGVFDRKKGTLVYSPNLNDWLGKPIQKLFDEVVGAPVKIFNDAVLAGVGEAHRGAGMGKSIVAYMTVSTGVGGACIVNGLPDEGRSGFEPGHQIMDVKSGLTLEDMVSGSAFTKLYGTDFVKIAPKKCWHKAAKILALGVHNVIMQWSPDIVVLGGSMMTKPPGIPLDVVKEELYKLPKVFPDLPDIVLAMLGDAGGLYGGLELLREGK